MSYRTIDLCAGIGGIRRGFELAGNTENVLSAEIDKYAAATYEHLFGEDPLNDLTSEDFKKRVEGTDYDILLAGFPCQPFSQIGKKQGFQDDTKGTIFFHIADIIERTRPKLIFLENVQGILTNDNRHTFRTIMKTLERKLDYKVINTHGWQGGFGYNPRDFVRDTVDFGLPQHRKRVYIIALDRRAFPGADAITDKLPTGNDLRIYEHFNDLLDTDVPIEYYVTEKPFAKRKANPRKTGYCGYNIINAPGVENPVANTLTARGPDTTWQWLVYDPRDGVSGMPLRGDIVNSEGIRHLTPNEYGKLQGFVNYGFMVDGVDTFSFPAGISKTQQYKMFGNSVSIPVIETLARFALDLMESLS